MAGAGLLALSALATPAPARADSSTDAALALGAFAVFNQLIRGETILHDILQPRPAVRETVVVQQPVVVPPPPPVVVHQVPVVVHQPPAVVYAPPPAVVYRYYYVPVDGFVPPGHAKKIYRGGWRHW